MTRRSASAARSTSANSFTPKVFFDPYERERLRKAEERKRAKHPPPKRKLTRDGVWVANKPHRAELRYHVYKGRSMYYPTALPIVVETFDGRWRDIRKDLSSRGYETERHPQDPPF